MTERCKTCGFRLYEPDQIEKVKAHYSDQVWELEQKLVSIRSFGFETAIEALTALNQGLWDDNVKQTIALLKKLRTF